MYIKNVFAEFYFWFLIKDSKQLVLLNVLCLVHVVYKMKLLLDKLHY